MEQPVLWVQIRITGDLLDLDPYRMLFSKVPNFR